MALYTRGGDAGETSLADGSRASKASARVEAYGSIDEAAAAIGFARQALEESSGDAAAVARIGATLAFAQQRLFNCSSALANPAAEPSAISPDDVAFLESATDAFAAAAGGWRGFTLASGGESACRLHLARTLTRRAERRIVALAAEAPVGPTILSFVNRLSDLLFATAGAAAAAEGLQPDLWQRDVTPPAL